MSSSAPSPRRGLPGWAWLLIVPAALVLAAWGLLTALFPPAKVRALVAAQLQSALAREVRFEDASLGLWPPVRLTVERFELAEPGGFSRGAAFATKAVELDLDVMALLGRKVVVRKLALDQPAVHLLLRADGSTNFDSLGAPPRPGAQQAPPMDLSVKEFSIRGGRVLVDDLKSARRTSLEVETAMDLATREGGRRTATSGRTTISALAFGPLTAARLSDLNQGLAKLRFQIEHRGQFDAPSNRLALDRLALVLGRTSLEASGVVELPTPAATGAPARAPRFDLKAKGSRLDLAEVLGWVSVADANAVKGLTGSGRVDFDLALRSAADAAQPLPDVTGVLTLRDAAFRYSGAPADVKGLSLAANFQPGRVAIPDIRATVAGQPIVARFTAERFADPLVTFAVQGNLDLGAVYPLVAQPGTTITGRAAVNVQGSGRAADPGSFALAGSARLANVTVKAANLPNALEGVNGDLAFSQQRATVKGLTARAAKSSFTLDADVARPLALMAPPEKVAPAGVTFRFRSPYLDLAEVMPSGGGGPVLPNATGGGDVEIARLKNGKLDVTQVAARVALAPAQLSSESFSMLGYGGTVRGNARFDLRDAAKPVYAITAAVEKVQADDLLSAWTPAKGLLHGSMSTTLNFSGKGSTPEDVKRSLTLIALAQLAEGKLGPGPSLKAVADFVKLPELGEVNIRDLKLPLHVENGRVVTNPVKFSGRSGDWLLAGSVGFDGTLDYAVSVTLPPAVAEALQARSALAAGAVSDAQGRVLLDLRVSGPAQKPRVAWDTRAMRDRLAGRASAAIEEQRAKLEAEAKAAVDARVAAAQDSARVALERMRKAAEDSVRRAAGNALQNFFGGLGKKGKDAPAPTPAPPPAPAPTPAPAPPADTAKADSTGRE